MESRWSNLDTNLIKTKNLVPWEEFVATRSEEEIEAVRREDIVSWGEGEYYVLIRNE